MSSMIQSYINIMQERNKNASPNYLQNSLRTNVKAYSPKGHLIKSNPFSLRRAVQADIESLKYFANGIQGKGNDYSVGRINDVAVKLGSLGIAGVLAASSGSPFKRGMEFIGLACWFGAMSLWPKLAINLPIKALKGVDLGLEYESSAGRRKNFFQDPQFLCWDLISDKDIHKMGDKLGVPRNIRNRRQAIENKARQVAIQGNTLALITAGFATPLIASLAADKIGKVIYTPILERKQELDASNLRNKMLANMNDLVHDQSLVDIINKKVTPNISATTQNELKELFMKKTDDVNLRALLAETIDNILENSNSNDFKIVLDEKINKDLAKMVLGQEPSAEILEKFAEKAKKFATLRGKTEIALNSTAEVNSYVTGSLNNLIKANRWIKNPRKMDKILDDMQEFLQTKKVVQINSTDKTKAILVDLANMIDTYKLKVVGDLDKYFRYTLHGDSSTNAYIWEKASNDIAKALKLDRKTIKALANCTSLDQSNKILGEVMDGIVNNPDRLKSTIKNLAGIATKLSTKNERALDFALSYVDTLQSMLNAYDKTGELAEISEKLNMLLGIRRKEILAKYMSTNNTLFAPIKALSILNAAKDNQNIDYETLKKIIFNSENAETFINKLDNYKDVIKNTDDYYKYVDILLGKLSPEISEMLPESLAKKINVNTQIMRVMLPALSDDVNTKFPIPSGNEVKNALKGTKFESYIDEYFELFFSNKDGLADKIVELAKNNNQKLDELRGILKLTAQDVENIKLGDTSSIYAALKGSKEIGKGYLDNGRFRFKHLLHFFGTNNIDELGEFTISKSKVGRVASIEGKTFSSFMKDSAKKIFTYQGWFKKVGIAFAALCGVTAISIAMIGKRNEFNPDIYRERRKA